ncbi:putative Endonuclease MutS2 [uncultured Desulfobacterium sp.]|uniref:Endonuclease MutS2 n=1 Tax=uncultured Desulfobacterium sp. TaxID=201089 RepID=A0A445MTS5_9BACT|nr:putative Endonuclease MutS2 [uncultured Desulfobacterium sp.]
MIEHTYQVLGYYQLLDILSQYAACPLGRSDCLSLKPSSDPSHIDNELRLVSETRLLLKTDGFIPLSDVTDVDHLLKKTYAAGSYLVPDELLSILKLAEAGRVSLRFLRPRRGLFPRLYERVKDSPDFGPLIKALTDTIADNGEIKDSASPTLKKIRQRKIRLRQELEKKLAGIQRTAGLFEDRNDSLITIRDGRYVVALRTDQKNRIDGIIHDYSQTKATCFIEPVDVIRDNNRAAELVHEEKEEEYHILLQLTGLVKGHLDDLVRTEKMIAGLDGLYARAVFGEVYSCAMPEIGHHHGICLKGARNPILQAIGPRDNQSGRPVNFPVPVDVILDEGHKLLVVSGPNRGGKTVVLKTLGLMCLMAQAGMHIPAKEGSCLPVFDQVTALIGDDQDIEAGLSTFSAHAAQLKQALDRSEKNCLVIIDEPGMGTDPDEGVALSMAVLDFLCLQGAFVAVSTHSNRLKAYGLTNQGAINAAVEFDIERNRPTFKLTYGVPGVSHGLEIARDMGIPLEVLDRARQYLDQDEVRLNRLIERLNSLILEKEDESLKAKALKERYKIATEEVTERLTSLEAEKRALIEAKRREADAVINQSREELKQAINLLKKKKESVQSHVSEIHARTTDNLTEYIKRESKDADRRPLTSFKRPKKGDFVYHRELKQKGVIQSITPSGDRAAVMLGNIKVSARIEDLDLIKGIKKSEHDQPSSAVTWKFKNGHSGEINVIGFRVDDAIPLIDKTLDSALVDGKQTLRIVHGFGTGKLKEAIRGYLRGVPFVKNISSAEPDSGGDAITVVEL